MEQNVLFSLFKTGRMAIFTLYTSATYHRREKFHSKPDNLPPTKFILILDGPVQLNQSNTCVNIQFQLILDEILNLASVPIYLV